MLETKEAALVSVKNMFSSERNRNLEKEIAENEALIKNLEDILMSDDVATDAGAAQKFYAEKVVIEKKVQEMYDEWDGLNK